MSLQKHVRVWLNKEEGHKKRKKMPIRALDTAPGAVGTENTTVLVKIQVWWYKNTRLLDRQGPAHMIELELAQISF